MPKSNSNPFTHCNIKQPTKCLRMVDILNPCNLNNLKLIKLRRSFSNQPSKNVFFNLVNNKSTYTQNSLNNLNEIL